MNMSVNNFDKILNSVHPQIDRRNCRCISSLIYISIFSKYLFDKVINAKSIFLFINATFGGLETTGRVATRLSAVWYKIPDSTKTKTQQNLDILFLFVESELAATRIYRAITQQTAKT